MNNKQLESTDQSVNAAHSLMLNLEQLRRRAQEVCAKRAQEAREREEQKRREQLEREEAQKQEDRRSAASLIHSVSELLASWANEGKTSGEAFRLKSDLDLPAARGLCDWCREQGLDANIMNIDNGDYQDCGRDGRWYGPGYQSWNAVVISFA